MKKETWWNEPMTRKNWAVVYLIAFGVGLIQCAYKTYAKSIDEFVKKSNEVRQAAFRKVKERF